jgi:prepilin signal peptidase PulO-like enzyme (type II secretory pathway)
MSGLEVVIFQIFVVVFLGAVFGSFASALVYRIPRDMPWFYEASEEGRPRPCRSCCTQCGYTLRFTDLIPLVSWFLQKGRCRSCSAPISALYPVIELTSILGFLLVYAVFGLTLSAVFIFLAIPVMVCLVYIDLEHFILPDELVFALAALGGSYLLFATANGILDWRNLLFLHVGGAVLFALFAYVLGWSMEKLLKKEALGFGDVKFFAVAGLWLGVFQFSTFLLLSGVMGIVFALIWRKIMKTEVFPFGPALITSFFTHLLMSGSHFL